MMISKEATEIVITRCYTTLSLSHMCHTVSANNNLLCACQLTLVSFLKEAQDDSNKLEYFLFAQNSKMLVNRMFYNTYDVGE